MPGGGLGVLVGQGQRRRRHGIDDQVAGGHDRGARTLRRRTARRSGRRRTGASAAGWARRICAGSDGSEQAETRHEDDRAEHEAGCTAGGCSTRADSSDTGRGGPGSQPACPRPGAETRTAPAGCWRRSRKRVIWKAWFGAACRQTIPSRMPPSPVHSARPVGLEGRPGRPPTRRVTPWSDPTEILATPRRPKPTGRLMTGRSRSGGATRCRPRRRGSTRSCPARSGPIRSRSRCWTRSGSWRPVGPCRACRWS